MKSHHTRPVDVAGGDFIEVEKGMKRCDEVTGPDPNLQVAANSVGLHPLTQRNEFIPILKEATIRWLSMGLIMCLDLSIPAGLVT